MTTEESTSVYLLRFACAFCDNESRNVARDVVRLPYIRMCMEDGWVLAMSYDSNSQLTPRYLAHLTKGDNSHTAVATSPIDALLSLNTYLRGLAQL